MRTLVWFRGKDLRLGDHAPLRDALEKGEALPVFVLDPFFFEPKRARELPHRMQYLLDALEELNGRIAFVEGRSVDVIPKLSREWKVDRVVAHRWSEPFARERDRRVAEALSVPFELFEGETLLPPGTLRNGSGEPYSIFTPFSHAFARLEHLGPPKAALSLKRVPASRLPTLAELGITRNTSLIRGGEKAARARLDDFDPSTYAELRNRMDLARTSRLSADLHFGTISVREVWHRTKSSDAFRNELVWRDYAHSTLWDFPNALNEPLRPEWRSFPWRDDEKGWRAWTMGQTGYPIVDAAQRQLLAEGFVHNRARMITAGFLTRHLMIDYRRGEAWFMKWLVDGDWANNDAGWQWSFGSGLDAQPYFRVFNPVAQGQKFDPTGAYVDRWVPELREVPLREKHLPRNPIVEHAFARERFISTVRRHLRSAAARRTRARPRA